MKVNDPKINKLNFLFEMFRSMFLQWNKKCDCVNETYNFSETSTNLKTSHLINYFKLSANLIVLNIHIRSIYDCHISFISFIYESFQILQIIR